MAYSPNPYARQASVYKEIGVKTASPGKLIVMLYEGATSNMEKAMALIEQNGKIAAKNIESYGNYLQKVMDIISELQASLNLDQGGEIAKNLLSLYIYFNRQILEATSDHKKEKIEFVHKMMSDLHDSWVTASLEAGNTTQNQKANSALNIMG